MKKLLAAAALLLATSSVSANAFEGTYRAFNCVKRGNGYYDMEMKFITGNMDHYGTILQSMVKYSSDTCRNSEEIGRRTRRLEYINLRPIGSDFLYSIDVKVGGRKVYDIITKYRYHGVPSIFFGKGGPARTESQRPTEIDENRRFGDASFGDF